MVESYAKQKSGTSNFERRKEEKGKGQKKSFTLLNVPKESLIAIIKEKSGVEDLVPVNTHTLNTRDKSKYCSFQKDVSHTIQNCIPLKKIIKKLIHEGHLKEYVLGTLLKDIRKGNERVIEVITLKVPSLTKIRRQIHF